MAPSAMFRNTQLECKMVETKIVPTFSSSVLRTDIHAVKFFGKFVFAGVGGELHVFDAMTAAVVTKEILFPGQKIHGFSSAQGDRIIIRGGRMCSIVQWKECERRLIIESVWSCGDWIMDVSWTCNDDEFLIATAHNMIAKFNWKTKKKVKVVSCEVKCVVFCLLLLGNSLEDFVAFSGTAFHDILIWSSTNDGEVCPLLHRLKGHMGTVFSVFYNSDLQLISSVSDDRSVRVWKVEFKTSGVGPSNVQWKEAKIQLIHSLYAHLSRVWKCFIVNDAIISLGEDSHICIWNKDGSLRSKWSSHQGGCAWCFDCSDELNLMVTGGGDGGISIWPLQLEKINGTVLPPLQVNVANGSLNEQESEGPPVENFPRRVGILDNGSCIMASEQGQVCCLKPGSSEWRVVLHNEKFVSYLLLQLSPCRKFVALATIHGDIIILSANSSTECGIGVVFEDKVVNGKIFSILWLTSEYILTCGPEGVVEVWKLNSEPESGFILKKIQECLLPPCRERWFMAASLQWPNLLTGDRGGSVYLYCLTGEEKVVCKPKQKFSRIHGRSGVTCIHWNGQFMSTGRDGTIRFYSLDQEEGTVEHLCANRLVVDWAARVLVYKGDILVLGFHEMKFIIWSCNEQRLLLDIYCGGGHRSWDFVLKDNQLHFTFIKDKAVHKVSCAFEKYVKPMLLSGIHIKQIGSLKYIPIEGESYPLLVAGSEDTTVRVLNPQTLKNISILRSHISSVRTVAVCPVHGKGKQGVKSDVLVFSAGGRAQMKVWRVMAKQGTQELLVACKEVTSHMVRAHEKKFKKPWKYMEVIHDPEARYMDLSAIKVDRIYDNSERKFEDIFLVAAACSDSFLRLFCFELLSGKLWLISTYKYHKVCILKICILRICNKIIVATFPTDGIIALWDVSDCVHSLEQLFKYKLRKSEDSDEENRADGNVTEDHLCKTAEDVMSRHAHLKPFFIHKIHQCGTNAIDWKRLSSDKVLVVTGGDDSAVNLTVIKFSGCYEQTDVVKADVLIYMQNPSSHFSQVTGIKILNNTYLSSAIDQRIKVWKWNYRKDSEAIDVELVSSYLTTVPDLQGMCVWESGSELSVCVHGKGIEVITLKDADT